MTPKFTASAVIIGTAIIILIGVGLVAISALALMWAWSAFVTPVFDLQLLSFKEAMGAIVLVLIIRFLTYSGKVPKK